MTLCPAQFSSYLHSWSNLKNSHGFDLLHVVRSLCSWSFGGWCFGSWFGWWLDVCQKLMLRLTWCCEVGFWLLYQMELWLGLWESPKGHVKSVHALWIFLQPFANSVGYSCLMYLVFKQENCPQVPSLNLQVAASYCWPAISADATNEAIPQAYLSIHYFNFDISSCFHTYILFDNRLWPIAPSKKHSRHLSWLRCWHAHYDWQRGLDCHHFQKWTVHLVLCSLIQHRRYCALLKGCYFCYWCLSARYLASSNYWEETYCWRHWS